jgi:hypothetical protein
MAERMTNARSSALTRSDRIARFITELRRTEAAPP